MIIAMIASTRYIKEPLKNVAAGHDPMGLKRGIDKAVDTVVGRLHEISRKTVEKTEIAQVAAISANNDESIGNLIADAMEKVIGSDRVEIFFAPELDLQPYYCLEMDPRGEVLDLLVKGRPNKVVAYELGISVRTVEVHRARIMQRMGVSSFAEMLRHYVLSGT